MVRCIYTGENYVLVIFKTSDVDISCWRYERNLLVIFQCHWELVKIPHTESGDPTRTLYRGKETDNGELTIENYGFIKKIHRHFNQVSLFHFHYELRRHTNISIKYITMRE